MKAITVLLIIVMLFSFILGGIALVYAQKYFTGADLKTYALIIMGVCEFACVFSAVGLCIIWAKIPDQ